MCVSVCVYVLFLYSSSFTLFLNWKFSSPFKQVFFFFFFKCSLCDIFWVIYHPIFMAFYLFFFNWKHSNTPLFAHTWSPSTVESNTRFPTPTFSTDTRKCSCCLITPSNIWRAVIYSQFEFWILESYSTFFRLTDVLWYFMFQEASLQRLIDRWVMISGKLTQSTRYNNLYG